MTANDKLPDAWLDIHGHFHPPFTPEQAASRVDMFRKFHFFIDQPDHWDAETQIHGMDADGIAMQMLSNVPHDHDKLRESNDYGASIVRQHPSRFGLLAALPTDDADAALREIEHAADLGADGFAMSTVYKDVMLGDPLQERMWARLNEMAAVVFIHPNAYAASVRGRPTPLVEVAFDTCRTVVDMLYQGVLRRYPDVTLVLAHCGGALPALSGRLELLGAESWVPNPERVTTQEIKESLSRLWVDTAATAKTGLRPAVAMVGWEHVVYGADCGVPCSTEWTMRTNRETVMQIERDDKGKGGEGQVLRNAWKLFPGAVKRHVEDAVSGR